MNNIQGLIQTVNNLAQNPAQILQHFGIPTECDTPEKAAQYLMNNGKVSQTQVNQANNLYKQIFNK